MGRAGAFIGNPVEGRTQASLEREGFHDHSERERSVWANAGQDPLQWRGCWRWPDRAGAGAQVAWLQRGVVLTSEKARAMKRARRGSIIELGDGERSGQSNGYGTGTGETSRYPLYRTEWS